MNIYFVLQTVNKYETQVLKLSIQVLPYNCIESIELPTTQNSPGPDDNVLTLLLRVHSLSKEFFLLLARNLLLSTRPSGRCVLPRLSFPWLLTRHLPGSLESLVALDHAKSIWGVIPKTLSVRCPWLVRVWLGSLLPFMTVYIIYYNRHYFVMYIKVIHISPSDIQTVMYYLRKCLWIFALS